MHTFDQNGINSIENEITKYSISNQHNEYFWIKWQYFNWFYEAFIFLSAPPTKRSPQRALVPYTQCVLLWLMLYFGCVWLDLVVFCPICSVVIICVFFVNVVFWLYLLPDAQVIQVVYYFCECAPTLATTYPSTNNFTKCFLE